MATTSSTALRRIAGFALTLLLICLCLSIQTQGQGASPLVTSTTATGLTPPPTFGAIWDSGLTTRGDFVIADFENAAVYQYPPGSGASITVFPAGKSGPGGGWANNGIAVDPWNNLWLNNNWNGGLGWVPWNAATGTWNVAAEQTVGTSLDIGGYYFQSAGMAVNASGTFILGTENGAPKPALYSFTIDSSGNTTNLQTVVASLTGRARTAAIDNAGNMYIFEDGGLSGVLMIPAGTINLANDKALVDVEPTMPDANGNQKPFLTNISGAAVDAAGNVYIGDGSAGIFMVPSENGTPNPADWVMISPVPATGQISVSPTSDYLFVPTSSKWNGVANAGIQDVAKVGLGTAELGSSPVGTAIATPGVVYYSFSGNVTPAKFVIQQDGAATPDFTVASGGTCAVGTTYPIPAGANSNEVTYCSLNIGFDPQGVGSRSAQLLMQTAQGSGTSAVYTTVATTVLHGTGLAPTILATPAWESSLGSGLVTPSQIATDAMGNVYVADSGLSHVLIFAAGSSASATPIGIGNGLTAPTGVAVDGTGNLYIADGGAGTVVEVPFVGNALYPQGQFTLVSKLGSNLKLAVDGLGHLYVADPANGRIVELNNIGGAQGSFGQAEVFLTSGFKNPSYVAVDSSNNLYAIDGANLFAVSGGAPTALINNLSNATALAVDPSGAVYISSAGGTIRIPYVSGALDVADEAAIAAAVTNPTAIALDNMGHVYLADGTALNIHVVSTNSALNFGNVALGAQPSLAATVTNNGNAPLTVTGYTSTNALDYSGADGTCIANSPVAPAATCQVQVTLAPGPGEQGTLTGQIGITSNAVNTPVVINATGVGAALAASVSSVSVGSSPEVINTPVTVTVKAASGSAVPTGQVKVSYTSFTVVNNPQTGPTITPVTNTMIATLVNGTATLKLTSVLAGSNTISVTYEGDRVFSRSTANTTASVSKSSIASLDLPANPPPFLPYVLEQNGSTPYDGSTQYWQYNFTVTVTTPVGMPSGSVTFMDSSSTSGYSGVACPQQSGAAVQPVNTSGKATFATDCLPMPQNVTYTPIVSTHTITPVYSGDANFQSFTGTATTFQVVRSPALIITSQPGSLSVTAGSSASANLTLTSILGYGFGGKNQQLNDYNFPVSLACSNLPPHATCTFSYPNPDANIPTAVDIPCTGTTAAADNCSPGSVTVIVNTNSPVGTTTSQIASTASLSYAALFGFGMVGLFFRRRVGKIGRMLLMLCLAILGGALSISLTACSTTNLAPSSVLTTPAGTYSVSITAVQVGTQVITLPTGPVTIYGSNNQVSLPFTLNVTVQ